MHKSKKQVNCPFKLKNEARYFIEQARKQRSEEKTHVVAFQRHTKLPVKSSIAYVLAIIVMLRFRNCNFHAMLSGFFKVDK